MTSKTKNIIAWILTGLLAFAFVGSGITKLLGVEMQIKNLESWGYPLWFRFPIGLTEIAFDSKVSQDNHLRNFYLDNSSRSYTPASRTSQHDCRINFI